MCFFLIFNQSLLISCQIIDDIIIRISSIQELCNVLENFCMLNNFTLHHLRHLTFVRPFLLLVSLKFFLNFRNSIKRWSHKNIFCQFVKARCFAWEYFTMFEEEKSLWFSYFWMCFCNSVRVFKINLVCRFARIATFLIYFNCRIYCP